MKCVFISVKNFINEKQKGHELNMAGSSVQRDSVT